MRWKERGERTYELGDEPRAALQGELVHLGGVFVLLAGLLCCRHDYGGWGVWAGFMDSWVVCITRRFVMVGWLDLRSCFHFTILLQARVVYELELGCRAKITRTPGVRSAKTRGAVAAVSAYSMD